MGKNDDTNEAMHTEKMKKTKTGKNEKKVKKSLGNVIMIFITFL